ncbi:unnamed protein product [Ophioblennius macclurei]
MPSIRSLTLTYEALNEAASFSEGDTITGTVTLALLKQTTVEGLFIKAKGDANVRWTHKSGDRTHTYTSHRRYFKLKQFLIPEHANETVLGRGNHVYNFSFRIPRESMPSSFKGTHGKIVYCLEAKLSRSWKIDTTAYKEITFASKMFPNLHALLSPKAGSTKKDIGLFSKGKVNMDVTIDKGAFAPGETVVIVAKINNSSSSEMTPKFSLQREIVFRANGHTKQESNNVHKVVDNCITAQTQKEVRCVMRIPRDLMMTIHNCDVISVSYNLKVCLDISFAFDPKVVFPVMIIPPELASGYQNGMAAGPYPAGAVGGQSNSDFPPPQAFMGPYPASPQAGSYGYAGPQRFSAPPPAYPGYPPAYPGPYGGHPSPSAPAAAAYGGSQVPYSPFASPSSTLHPPPTAPELFPRAPTPSAPPSQPPPPSLSPSAPSYNSIPSAPMPSYDFLSQTDEPPPSYSVLFPSSTPDANSTSDAI